MLIAVVSMSWLFADAHAGPTCQFEPPSAHEVPGDLNAVPDGTITIGTASTCDFDVTVAADVAQLNTDLAADPNGDGHAVYRVVVEPGSHALAAELSVSAGAVIVLQAEACDGTSTSSTATLQAPAGQRVFSVRDAVLEVGPQMVLQGNAAAVPGDGGVVEVMDTATHGFSTTFDAWLHVEGELVAGRAEGDGGCVAMKEGGLLTMNGAEVHDCRADGEGGGIFVDQPGTGGAILTASHIHDNQADVGGGLYVQDVTAELNCTDVEANTARTHGGGIMGDISADLQLVNTRVLDNGRAGSSAIVGSGIYLQSSTLEMDVGDCDTSTLPKDRWCSEIRGNTDAGLGGAILARGSTVNVVRTLLDSNGRSALHAVQSTVSVDGSIVTGHTASSSPVGALFAAGDLSTLDVTHCTIDGNSIGVEVGAQAIVTVTSSVVQDDVVGSPTGTRNVLLDVTQVTGTENVDDDPLFDALHPRSVYKLQSVSPVATLPADARSTPLDIDGVGTGLSPNRGALELDAP